MVPSTTEVRYSTCALDCPDCCSLLVTVENGKAIRLRGNPDHPVTRGFLCAKVARYLEREYSSDRVLYPQRRVGVKGEGRFTRISWDEALDEIAEKLTSASREFGPESILPYSYGGTLGFLQGASMDRRFFHRLGASRLDRTICSSAGGAALMRTLGARYGTEPEQFKQSKLILAWGANILGTNVHLWPFIVEARRNGAKFYTIDPVRNRTGKLSDRHFFIHPGTDQALAFGMMRVIFAEGLHDVSFIEAHTNGFEHLRRLVQDYTPERTSQLTGLPSDDVVFLAREYATTKPAAIRVNYGVQRSERGGAAISAIAMLPALTGSWKEVGGGLQLSTSQAFQVKRSALEMPELQERSPLGGQARIVNMTLLGKALTETSDPPVKALFVYNSNPASIAPNQSQVLAGLRRSDLFTVVAEQFQTDTADYADILLPATTFLEHTDLYFAYGHYYIQMARPIVEPPGESVSNTELFRRLAARMGCSEPCFRDSEDDMIRQALDSGHEFLRGITWERLEKEHSIHLNVSEPGQPFLPFAKGFLTPSGKCELSIPDYVPPAESWRGEERSKSFPLELVSAKNDDSMNSTFGYRLDQDRETSTLHIHSDDAQARGIANGDTVRVFNRRGSIRLHANVDGAVSPGVVSARSSRWLKMSPDHANVNTLVSDRLTDIGEGPTFYNCLVEVEKCGD